MAQAETVGGIISRIQLPDAPLERHTLRASAIPYGQVDSTSTATAFTATVPGINVLRDGVCVLLKNGVVTSASGFTINVNGLGAKPSYTNLAAATRDTTIFNIGYTMLFIYDEDRVSGGCWICYRGYDANTNTIGYQIRSNSSTLPAADKGYGYRLWFTSADGSKWVPANKSTSTDSTTSKTPNTTPIDPFGPIVYNSTNGTVNANASLPAATLWQQYTLTIGYSFNEPGGAMAYPAPVYLKCTPQTNGSAVMSELVQVLPSTDDGFIYILLGRAYSATAIELIIEHPVFYNDGTGIRAWTGKKPFSGSYADLTNKPSIPTKTSDLTNDSSFITAAQAPVTSVNTQTGAVTLSASDVGALSDTTDLSIYMQKGVDYVTAGQKSGTTLGTKATAEGLNTTSSNSYTHAEGSYTIASGSAAHAEGNWTQASGSSAHAEGQNTIAEGSFSHAEGNYTIAHNKSQHVFGEFNVAENKMNPAYRGTYIEIVGNGTADTARSNARTLDWSGNETLTGKLTVGAGPTNAMDVATKQYVDTGISNITFPVTSVNGQTGAITTAEKFVITATAISGTEYYNLNKTYADIVSAINQNKYVAIQDVDMTYPYTTTVSQGIVFGATLIATGEGGQLLAVTDGILVAQSGSSTLGMAVHSSIALPTMSDIPSASSTTPSMDGTAAVGTGTTWARADHVHPTDTSRQAVLVSGTNIKTINNESILGSGNISISAGSSDVFIAEYGVTTYADILAAYEAGKAIFCQKIASTSLNNTKVVSILPLAYIGSSDTTASASRKAIFKNMSGNYSLDQTNITSWTVSGVSGQWSSENIETDTSVQGILSINISGSSTYLYSNSVNGIVKDDGTGVLSAAVAGTDYQAPLVSGTNIKTINNTSLLGSGNIDISGGVGALNSTSKLYLVGAENQQSSVTSYSNSNVYATNGVLNAKSFSVDASANIVYNSSSKSIDFTFV